MDEQTKHPILTVVRGMPGSGKSFIAAELQKALGTENVVLLDPDAIDLRSPEYLAHTKSLVGEGVDRQLHPYRFLRAQAYKAIAEKKIIIWDQPFTNLEIFNKMVGRLKDCAAENHTSLPILIVEVDVSADTAKARVAERKIQGGHGPSEGTLEKRIGDYKSFASEGYQTIAVSGDGNVDSSVSTILKMVENLQ